ncbi:hypothetical protein [Streptomyces violaceusniger]|uniref:hypothetical protein n=1 Tax=Streptomyces violaceusniger TaxID=68280 RepID=UPI0009968876|nr:hypothetical protein [Streptomyces hygroscopicus]
MNTTASFARSEWGPLYTTVRAAVAARGWRVVPLTLPVLTQNHEPDGHRRRPGVDDLSGSPPVGA